MSRSGYVEDCENINLYRQAVHLAIVGRRGQAFLRELERALLDLPHRRLITDELVTREGECCAIGAVALLRGQDMSDVDAEDPDSVAAEFGIASSLAAEIEYMNDEECSGESPEQRYDRMLQWVQSNIKGAKL